MRTYKKMVSLLLIITILFTSITISSNAQIFPSKEAFEQWLTDQDIEVLNINDDRADWETYELTENIAYGKPRGRFS